MSSREPPLLQLPPSDNQPLWDIWMSAFQLPALTVADELGFFVRLNDKPSTSRELAESMAMGERSVTALLNLLAALGIIDKHEAVFSLNTLSRSYLLPDSEHYWGGVLHTVCDMPVSHAMIMNAVRRDSGETGPDIGFQRFTDDWLEDALPPDKTAAFTAKMHSHGFTAALFLSRNPVFRNSRRLLDIGGGSGSYSIALAAEHPEIKCTVADLPAVCMHTRDYIARYHLGNRIETHPFNMFRDTWPSGYDTVFMSDILHDWNDADARSLLQHAFACLPSGGYMHIHEVLLEEDGVGPTTANAYSLAMLMVTEGRQFTWHEIRTLLAECGFIDIAQTRSYGYYSLITGRKP